VLLCTAMKAVSLFSWPDGAITGTVCASAALGPKYIKGTNDIGFEKHVVLSCQAGSPTNMHTLCSRAYSCVALLSNELTHYTHVANLCSLLNSRNSTLNLLVNRTVL
jgi:hypothetical protein